MSRKEIERKNKEFFSSPTWLNHIQKKKDRIKYKEWQTFVKIYQRYNNFTSAAKFRKHMDRKHRKLQKRGILL